MDHQAPDFQHLDPRASSLLDHDAQSTARLLAQSLGAETCHLMLMDYPSVLVTSAAVELDLIQREALLGYLRQVHERSQPIQLVLGQQPALALPLGTDAWHGGAALLCYAHADQINVAQAQAATSLAAHTLRTAAQVTASQHVAATVRQQALLREIQVSRNLIRGVIDSIPLGLVLLNATGTLLAINRALATRVGGEPARLVGSNYRAVIGPWEGSTAEQTLATGVSQQAQRVLTNADGAVEVLEIISFPLLDDDNTPYQVVEIWEDMTQRTAMQAQLVRTEKLAAIGQLAASVAHEVGNPLQAIQGFLALFLEQCPPEVPNRAFLELTESEINRIVEVLARLRSLYRAGVEVASSAEAHESVSELVHPVDINAVIDKVLRLTSQQLERGQIEVGCYLDPTLPQIKAVANQLNQVLLNLVLNALDAMGSGGVLRIQTSARQDDAVVIEVTDTGVGIPPDQISHIFNGLYTTKEQGMGLGLYTSKRIIESHGGRITVRSMVGQGTTFVVTLPMRS